MIVVNHNLVNMNDIKMHGSMQCMYQVDVRRGLSQMREQLSSDTMTGPVDPEYTWSRESVNSINNTR